jgi:hypothetical protein
MNQTDYNQNLYDKAQALVSYYDYSPAKDKKEPMIGLIKDLRQALKGKETSK